MLSSTTPIDAFRASRVRQAVRALPRNVVDTPRGQMPDVLVVEAGGYETAREHPEAVVVDRERRCLRRDRLRLDMRSEQAFRMVEFMLSNRDQPSVGRDHAASVARAGLPRASHSHVTGLINQANRAFGPLGLRVESIWGGTLRLVATKGSLA